jgi:hypothetical protein
MSCEKGEKDAFADALMARPDPPRVPIPLTWLESNFNTRPQTEHLLRPELHNGLISQHDFDAAVDFFPGPQRYYSVRYPFSSFLVLIPLSQIAGGIVGTLSIIIYGQFIRRTPIPINRIASLAAVASAGGVIGGTFVRANAHADFFRNLDNRPAFFQAIDNIQSRLGEKPAGQHADLSYSYPSSDNEKQEMADGAVTARGWEETTVDVNRATLSPNPGIVTRPIRLYRPLSFSVP